MLAQYKKKKGKDGEEQWPYFQIFEDITKNDPTIHIQNILEGGAAFNGNGRNQRRVRELHFDSIFFM